MIIGAWHVNGYLKIEQHIHQTNFTTTATVFIVLEAW